MGDVPIATGVAREGGELLLGVPLGVTARHGADGWTLRSEDGGEVRVDSGQSVALSRGELRADVGIVRVLRLPRFGSDQGDLVLPVIMLATMVLVLQLAFLQSLFAQQEGAGAFEPSPEYIARLLQGQLEGHEEGVAAEQVQRPHTGEKIEQYYLQPGHDGPRTRIGGGKNLGEAVRDGDVRRRRAAPPEPDPGASPEPIEEPPPDQAPEVIAQLAEEDTKGVDQPIAVHVDEGWGLTDWYDTEDARQDAREIERELRMAQQVLRIAPDDPNALSVLAYYQYLAMDFKGAEKTYARFTDLYPEESAGWNNLALTYKRRGEYEKEEALYRVALNLEPNEDHALNNLAVCLAHQGRYDEALAIMKRLETLTPDDPYADLHRAKIYAAMGSDERAYRHLQKSLNGMRKLDTLHNIEFRQDIRVDPAFDKLRKEDRFRRLLMRYYGDQPGGWWKPKATR